MLAEKISVLLWGTGTIIFILGSAVFLTARLHFFQFLHPFGIFRATVGSLFDKKRAVGEISPFQALSTVLAATMGTGNIAGVAAAIAAGGSGAVFWMVASSVLISSAAYAENYLGVKYGENHNSLFGAMSYIKGGLGKIIGSRAAGVLAAIYACACVVSSLGSGCMSQSGAAADAAQSVGIAPLAAGIVSAMLLAAVIFRGGKSAAAVAEKLIPFVSVVYIGAAAAVTIINYREIPREALEMLRGAFGINQAAAGISGAIIKRSVQTGLRRGIFSNEAGMGSSVLAHASSGCKNPHLMGMWAVAEVFLDTVICCTMTAFAVLCTGSDCTGAVGSEMVSSAFRCIFGNMSEEFTVLCTAAFAFAAMIGWYFYGEKCLEYLAGNGCKNSQNNKKLIGLYKVLYVGAAIVGAVCGMNAVWSVTDICSALMLFPNMIAVLMLSGEVK